MHKNFKLLLLLIGLLIISLSLNFFDGSSSSSNLRTDLFQVDTSAVNSITISGTNAVELKRNSNGWEVNDKYRMSGNLRQILMAVLQQVAVRRPVSQIQRGEIAGNLRSSTKVSISGGAGDFAFYVGGNPARTQSYFMMAEGDNPYIVEIPGYRNFIAGIFQLSEFQWRDRTLFSTPWRSLQSLEVQYPENSSSDLNIAFEDKFFAIEGVSQMDTTTLMNYLSGFELFEANEFIPDGFSPVYDSLKKTSPIATIRLTEINRDFNQELSVYAKIEDDPYVLTSNRDGELSLVEFSRLAKLLGKPSDFQ